MLELYIWAKPKQVLRLEVIGHQDKMLREMGDKEFPSLESEKAGSLGISWPHLLRLQMGDWGPEKERDCSRSHSQFGQNQDQNPRKVQAKFREDAKFSQIPYAAGRKKRISSFWIVQI